MRLLVRVLPLCLLCLLVVGCMRGYDYTIDYRNRFFERLKSFEHKRAQIKTSFALVFTTLEKKLQSPKPNFGNIAWEWEARLRGLKRRLDELDAELVKMDTLSKFFYRQLHEMSHNMTDAKVKEREKHANTQHERDWKRWRAYAQRNIKRAYEALATGHDAHKVFISSGIRTKRETALKTTREVRHGLFSALRRLERFAHATELLMSLEKEDLIPTEIKQMQRRRDEIARRLKRIARTMEKRLMQQGGELQEVAWSWENDYVEMRYELESLSDDFENVKVLTQAYYDKSAYHIEKIVHKEIREEEVETQTRHHQKLTKAYERIERLRKTISADLLFADDTYQVLINAARRKDLASAIEKLVTIREKLEHSLEGLKDALDDVTRLFTYTKPKKTAKP